MKNTILLSSILCLISLASGVGIIILTEFGILRWLLLILLTWMVTLGLPTTLAILLLASFWSNLPLGGFLLASVLFAFLFQFGTLWAIRWGTNLIRQLRETT